MPKAKQAGSYDLVEKFTTVVNADMVDFENCVIKGARLLNHQSRNKRNFAKSSGQICEQAEGAPVTLGHNNSKYEDVVGVFSDIQEDSNGGSGSLYLKPEHPLTKRILADCASERFSKTLAMSIEIPRGHWTGKRNCKTGIMEVNSVTKVKAVALVTEGGNTQNIFESLNEETDMTLEELKEKYPEQFEAYRKEIEDIATSAIEAVQPDNKAHEALILRAANAETALAASESKADALQAKLNEIAAASERAEKIESWQAKATESNKEVELAVVEQYLDIEGGEALLETYIEALPESKETPKKKPIPAPNGSDYTPKQTLTETLGEYL